MVGEQEMKVSLKCIIQHHAISKHAVSIWKHLRSSYSGLKNASCGWDDVGCEMEIKEFDLFKTT